MVITAVTTTAAPAFMIAITTAIVNIVNIVTKRRLIVKWESARNTIATTTVTTITTRLVPLSTSSSNNTATAVAYIPTELGTVAHIPTELGTVEGVFTVAVLVALGLEMASTVVATRTVWIFIEVGRLTMMVVRTTVTALGVATTTRGRGMGTIPIPTSIALRNTIEARDMTTNTIEARGRPTTACRRQVTAKIVT